jgi:multicomponent K+:H+ antiporter subunit E
MRRRLLPAPLLSLALLLAWLMLNESVSAGQLLVGGALAIAVPLVTERRQRERARLRHWGTLVRLAATVLADIVRSNLVVARLILGPERCIQPRFVWLPLAIRDPHGVVALAGIITMTPGTLSADLSDDRRHLLIHAFDVDDDAAEAALIADIRQRYEAPLMHIFEGDPRR